MVYAICGIGKPARFSKLRETPWFPIGCVRGPNTLTAQFNEIKGRLGIRKTVSGIMMFFTRSFHLGGTPLRPPMLVSFHINGK